MVNQAQKRKNAVTFNVRTKSTKNTSFVKKSSTFKLWDKNMSKYIKELDAMYPDYDPNDPSISAITREPTRLFTEFQESAPKVNFSRHENDARFHAP
jgi:hypothetical protein